MIRSITFAAVSDIHGNIPALEAVVADINSRKISTVVNLGDLVSGPLWPKETAVFLMQQNWTQIAGNHERQLTRNDPRSHIASDRYAFGLLSDEQKEWLRELPGTFILDESILLCHGGPLDDTVYLLETVDHGRTRLASPGEIGQRISGASTPVILCGHTHLPRAVSLGDGTLIVNPGSVGLPAFQDAEPVPHVVETGSPHARYAVFTNSNGAWTVDLVHVPYDYRRAAKQAEANNRPDWTIALRTGYMS